MATLTKEVAAAHRLIPEINAHYREFKKSASDSLKNAIKIGELLLEMKEALHHGEFTDAIEQRCDFTPEWGRICMKVAGGKDVLAKVEYKPESIREAVKIIADNTPQKKTQNKTPSSVLKSTTPKVETTSEKTDESDDPIGDACQHVWDDDGDCRKCKMPRPDEFDPAELESETLTLDLKAKQVKYDAYLNHITQAKKLWNEIVSDERDGCYAVEKRQRVLTALESCFGPVAQARPHSLCDHCQGAGCKKCSNCGWWPRSVVEGLKK